MPRKISIIKKREWLKDYEEGKTEISIARKGHCDVRTLKKGIQEARLERDAGLARAELIKEALHKHNEALLEIIRGLLSSIIKLPSPEQRIPWEYQSPSGSISIDGGKAQYELWPEPRVLGITLDVEHKMEWELLQEHLRLDSMWRLLTHWKKALAIHLEARIVMSLKLADLIKDKTGYQMADKSTDGPFIYNDAVDFLTHQMIKQSRKLIDTDSLEQKIAAVPSIGSVVYFGMSLAYAPGREEECRQNILDVVSEIEVSQEMTNVLNTFQVTEDITRKASRAAQELLMLGLVPGQCRVCRRLGK